MLLECAQLYTFNGRKHGVKELAEKWDVGANYFGRSLVKPIEALGPKDTPFVQKERSDKCVPRKYTEHILELAAEQAEKWDYNFTFEDMALWLIEQDYLISATGWGLARQMDAQGWNTHTSCRVKPTLTDDHREARLAFCRLYLNQDWSEWIDIDEKWFYTIKAYSKRKLPPGASLPHETVRHKSHIPKVMFIAAMARPKPGQHDGKIGMWRISEPLKWTRKSNGKHVQGEWYEKDITVDCDTYFKFMTEKVFPSIRHKFARCTKTIIVQQDCARPHTGKDMVNRLNIEGAARFPQIKVVTQPAQSPESTGVVTILTHEYWV